MAPMHSKRQLTVTHRVQTFVSVFYFPRDKITHGKYHNSVITKFTEN